MRSNVRSRGFTLIELLVVIAIIAILVALLLPAVQQVREAARKSQCQDHLHNIVIAVMNYEGAHKILPMGASMPGTGTDIPSWGWAAAILPFNEQKPMYDTIGVATRSLGNALSIATIRPNLEKQIDVYVCPSDNSPETMQGTRSKNGTLHNQHWDGVTAPMGWYAGTANYMAVFGHKVLAQADNTGAMFRLSGRRVADLQDGLSNLFVIGERDQECAAGTWVGSRNGGGSGARGNNYVGGTVYQKPNGICLSTTDCANTVGGAVDTRTCIYGFSSKHPGGTQFALGDGKVTFVSENIDHNNNYCATVMGSLVCDQNREGFYANTTVMAPYNGQPIGVYQRLGISDDGLPVRVP